MATDPEALLAQLNEIRDQLARDPALPRRPDFVAKLHGLAGTLESGSNDVVSSGSQNREAPRGSANRC